MNTGHFKGVTTLISTSTSARTELIEKSVMSPPANPNQLLAETRIGKPQISAVNS
ncbi:MAG: hypothetical protein IH840_00180 [Candidatus Heimdallarchaeota archaeon]|nr:hypothetical protein [Candidatus Heimdallarchaeota archaeon]